MTDFLVVGGGLFGSVIARALDRAGCEVVIVDDGRALAGSAPAACLMKPSWFASSMSSRERDDALALLAELYGVRELRFTVDPTRGQVSVFWVDPADVLGWGSHLRRRARAMRVLPTDDGWSVELESGSLGARRVVVCAGVWANDLLPQALRVPGLEPRMGAAFLWPGRQSEPHIYPGIPNPYRQLVKFNRGDGVWSADGTSVKLISDNQIATSLKRCSEYAQLPAPKARVLLGIRPYVREARPCYLEQPARGLWVATGGAKNGTIAAAWCARRLAREYEQ